VFSGVRLCYQVSLSADDDFLGNIRGGGSKAEVISAVGGLHLRMRGFDCLYSTLKRLAKTEGKGQGCVIALLQRISMRRS
jgi:hypothetical protein